MRLRTKLLGGILGTLLLQMAVTGTFTLTTFLRTANRQTETSLRDDWEHARSYLEQLKHRLYTDVFQLTFLLEDGQPADTSGAYLTSLMRQFISLTNVDRIVLVEDNGAVVADERAGVPATESLPAAILDPRAFRFPTNLFVTAADRGGTLRLYLVTGTTIVRAGRPTRHLYLVTDVDRSMVEEILEKTGTEIAFYLGKVPLVYASELQPFDTAGPLRVRTMRFGDRPYSVYARPLSADLRDHLYLVSMRSTLEEALYVRSVLISYLTAFLVTLAASLFLAAGITSLTVNPFTRLAQWLHRYLDSGEVRPLTIRSRDETGFLAGAFYSMVSTLIADKRTVSDQLEQIRQLHAYNERIMNGIQAAIVVTGDDGAIEFCNRYFAELVGETELEALHGRNFRDLMARSFVLRDGRPVAEAVTLERDCVIEGLKLERPGEEPLHFTAKLSPMGLSGNRGGFLIVLEDVTASERFWAGMTVADRVTSLGILSAGVAHEINNPLGSILSHVSYLKAVEKRRGKLDSLEWIESETNRIAAIIKRMRAYSAPEGAGVRTADLNQVARQTVELLRFTLEKRQMRLSLELAEEVGQVLCPPDELKQVVLNILLNACEASVDGGSIRVGTHLNGQGTAVLTIGDQGAGIDPARLKNIFEPFYTTKSANQGNGLGLSICYAIVKRAGGDIRVTSAPGVGTEVEVTLSVHDHPDR